MGADKHLEPERAAAAKDGVVEGVTPGSVAHEWLGGLGAKLVDRRVDNDTHNLHTAVGQVCPTCRHLIEAGQPVRKTVSGAYKHDAC
jgi:hypothetical protein